MVSKRKFVATQKTSIKGGPIVGDIYDESVLAGRLSHFSSITFSATSYREWGQLEHFRANGMVRTNPR